MFVKQKHKNTTNWKKNNFFFGLTVTSAEPKRKLNFFLLRCFEEIFFAEESFQSTQQGENTQSKISKTVQFWESISL